MEKKTWGRRRTILAASFLAAAFVVTGGLALQARAQAAQYKLLVANGYQHAFAELATAVSELDAALEKGVYATSPGLFSSLCTQAYGKAMSAQMALGELPYGNIELEQTAAFLAKAGDYAMYLSRTAASDGDCGSEARESLRAISQGAASLNGMLQSLQSDLNAGVLTLGDLEQAEARLSSATEDGSPELAGSAFQSVEKEFPEVPTLIYDGPFSDHIAGRTARMLERRAEVTQDEARAAAAKFLDLKPEIFDFMAENAGKIPCYCFSAAVDGGEVYVSVSKQGGLVVEVMNSRAVAEAALSREEAASAAADFLVRRGYPNMVESYSIDQGNVLTVNFAASQDGVICYPDLVKVSVALDNGRIVGFESQGYLMNHQNRALPSPAAGLGKAQDRVSGGLRILSQRLALIPTAGENEVLCYEFKCQDEQGGHVLVYVNAQTGQEEKILILLEDESGTLAV